MHSIHLNGLRFFAHHGIHDEETLIGTEFEVNLSLDMEPGLEVKHLRDTVNYVEVYDLIRSAFAQPVKLLETLANDIVDRIALLDNRIKQVHIRVTKLNPPIANFIGNVSVSFYKSF